MTAMLKINPGTGTSGATDLPFGLRITDGSPPLNTRVRVETTEAGRPPLLDAICSNLIATSRAAVRIDMLLNQCAIPPARVPTMLDVVIAPTATTGDQRMTITLGSPARLNQRHAALLDRAVRHPVVTDTRLHGMQEIRAGQAS